MIHLPDLKEHSENNIVVGQFFFIFYTYKEVSHVDRRFQSSANLSFKVGFQLHRRKVLISIQFFTFNGASFFKSVKQSLTNFAVFFEYGS